LDRFVLLVLFPPFFFRSRAAPFAPERSPVGLGALINAAVSGSSSESVSLVTGV
jgi:hypothetical protein